MTSLNYQLPNNLGELMQLEEKIKVIWMPGFNGELDKLVEGYFKKINKEIARLIKIEPNPDNAL
jgi:hypothetical protein